MFDLIRERTDACPLGDMTLDDLSGGKIYRALSKFAFCLVDIGLLKANGKNYPASTLLNYFGAVHGALHKRCDKLSGGNFKNDDLFKSMKEALKKRLQERDIKGRSDVESNDTYPLYKHCLLYTSPSPRD